MNSYYQQTLLNWNLWRAILVYRIGKKSTDLVLKFSISIISSRILGGISTFYFEMRPYLHLGFSNLTDRKRNLVRLEYCPGVASEYCACHTKPIKSLSEHCACHTKPKSHPSTGKSVLRLRHQTHSNLIRVSHLPYQAHSRRLHDTKNPKWMKFP